MIDFLKHERGSTSIEGALLITLIGVSTIGSLNQSGLNVSQTISKPANMVFAQEACHKENIQTFDKGPMGGGGTRCTSDE